ncbi:MAG: hypothetical protein EFT35_10370 [Methanophagales archaeon ANME-1-THS]|nr:MAG: hypothetical protein EFT35_10370 [Methanophagales archaeon ANME-1-THS]
MGRRDVVRILRLPLSFGKREKGKEEKKELEISELDFERFRQIDERLLTTFPEKSALETILKKARLSLPELRAIVKLIAEIESKAQSLLGERIGVRVIAGEEIGIKVITLVAREEKRRKLLSLTKAGTIAGSPHKVHSQLIINLLGTQWSVVDKSHHAEIYAMIIAQCLGHIALVYPEVCAKLSINPTKLADEMIERYKEVFGARELWINMHKVLATKIGQLIIGEKTYNAGARWIIDYDLPQAPPEKESERLREEPTEKIHALKREQLPMLAGWQAEALITDNRAVAEQIEAYVAVICKEPLRARYQSAVADFVRAAGTVTAGVR